MVMPALAEMSTGEGFMAIGRLLGLPLGTLWIRSWWKRRLREQQAPPAIQHGAAHVVFCMGLWAFVLSRLYSGTPPAGVDLLGMVTLVFLSPGLSLINLFRLADVGASHAWKQPLIQLCLLHWVGLAVLVYSVFPR